MAESANYEDILAGTTPLRYRLCRALNRRGRLPRVQAWLARSVRERDCVDWEWHCGYGSEQGSFEAHLVAPRIVTSIRLAFETPPKDPVVTVKTWRPSGWEDEPVDVHWSLPSESRELRIRLRRLVLTSRLTMHIDAHKEGGINIALRLAQYAYRDAEHLGIARQALDNKEYHVAERHLRDTLDLTPNHFTAAYGMARVCEKRGKWSDVRLWAMTAFAYSRGNMGGDLLRESCEKEISNLAEEVPQLKESAADWEVGGHHGAVCLLNKRRYWLGFDRCHFAKTRQVIEIRRQAAARLLGRLHFDFSEDNESLMFARLRILRTDGQVIEVPTEQLAILDDPEQNPAVRTQHRHRAFFHLPEVNRGDCLELEYALVHSHPSGPDEKPDIFIMADLNCEFPTRRSVAEVKYPRDWDLTCLGVNGAPAPTQREDSERWKVYECTAERLFYDEWGTVEMERQYRSPHLCCAWGGRRWEDIGEYALRHGCHAPRDDTLPDVLQDVLDGADSDIDKLHAGFDWVRDRLKYMSLRSAKARSNAPDLAKQIVGAGVADCMDKAYLMLLICRQLGIEAEYVVAALESGYIVTEMPAQQFDHILVRAKLNGEWVHLDGTSSQTPFSWIPPQLQGLRVLPLASPFELETVPEENPERNSLEIRETLRCTTEGQLTGEFAIKTKGFPARWWDEQWKGASMTSADPYRAASLALRQQFPSANLKDWKSQPLQPGKEICGFSGSHSRRTLLPIDGGQVGIVDWHTPLFPLYRGVERNWSGLTVFPLPITYSISCRVECPEGWTISGSSPSQQLKTEFGHVTAEITGDSSFLDAKRSLMIGKRFVAAEHAEKIPGFLSAWDDAMRFAFILRK